MHNQSIYQTGRFDPCPTSFNLAQYVLAAGRATPDKPALLVYDQNADCVDEWSYQRLTLAVEQTAAGFLGLWLAPGSKVLLRIGNTPDFPIVYLAAIAAGMVPSPTSPLLTDQEVDYIIDTLNPAVIIASGDCTTGSKHRLFVTPSDLRAADASFEFAKTQADDLAYVIFTSGTSGTPQAVMHAHRAVWARRMMWRNWYDLLPDDRMLHAGAFNWTFTLGTGLMDPWATGATSMIYSGPADRHVWAKIAQRHCPTLFAGAPGIFRQILATGEAAGFTGLRHCLTAGERMPDGRRNAWTVATGHEIYEALGMTEVSTFISSSPQSPPRAGTSGKPQIGRTVAVLDQNNVPVPFDAPGTLAVSTDDPGLMLGYLHETKAAVTGDWFPTGDTVSMDMDGYITYLGRLDDMLNAGGFRVSPLEVEAKVCEHPNINEAAVVAQEVSEGTEILVAYYVAEVDILSTDLVSHCAARLARYKCPKEFRRIDTLPKGGNGKIMRKELRMRSL